MGSVAAHFDGMDKADPETADEASERLNYNVTFEMRLIKQLPRKARRNGCLSKEMTKRKTTTVSKQRVP